jgi:hypothetical protein
MELASWCDSTYNYFGFCLQIEHFVEDQWWWEGFLHCLSLRGALFLHTVPQSVPPILSIHHNLKRKVPGRNFQSGQTASGPANGRLQRSL